MIDDKQCRDILIKIVNDNIKDWKQKPKVEIVFDSLLCAIVIDIDKERRVQLAAFKKSELDDYLTGSRYHVESRIKRSLLQLQRKFYSV